ncbi:MAG: 2-oxoacid:acceptor oxidoreductase family protein [Candidatus Hermodarchaeota archaeon]
MSRYEVRIVGYGGQGVITLSKMIINASSLYGNLAATQTEAYGSSARGGKCWAEVVIDLDKNIKSIDYPKAMEPYDFLVVLSEEAAKNVKPEQLKKDENTGYLIWDTSTIQSFRAAKQIGKAIGIPIQKIAVEVFNNMVFGNSILFGVFTSLSRIFSEQSAIETIKKFVPKSTINQNLEAFELGKHEAEKYFSKSKEEKN